MTAELLALLLAAVGIAGAGLAGTWFGVRTSRLQQAEIAAQRAATERALANANFLAAKAAALIETAVREAREHELKLVEHERLSTAAQLEKIVQHHQDAMERFFPRQTGVIAQPVSPEAMAAAARDYAIWTDPEELHQIREGDQAPGETTHGE